MNRYEYGTEVTLWYVDEDKTDVQKMVREFKVDSSKIDREEMEYDDGRPTPDEIDAREDW